MNGSVQNIDNVSYMQGGSNSTPMAIMDNGSVVAAGSNGDKQLVPTDTFPNISCYWNGSANTPCTTTSQDSDVFIYNGLHPNWTP